MERKYEIIKDEGYIEECDKCGSQAPLYLFRSGLDEKYLCKYCSNSFGPGHQPVTNATLGNLFNVLEKSILKKMGLPETEVEEA